MSELAIINLRQARSFARAGNSAKAIELLEKARVLARGDGQLLARVLDQLAESYDAVGRMEQAARCREQASRLNPQPQSPAMLPGRFAVSQSRSNVLPWIVGGAVAALACIAIGIVAVMHPWSSSRPLNGGQFSLIQPQAAAPPQLPLTRPATPLPAVTAAKPLKAPTPAADVAALPPLPNIDRQDMLKEDVGLVMVIVHFQGPVDNGTAQLDIPLGSGTAFAVSSSGLMLTNKHVVDAAKESNVPQTLEKVNMPMVTNRGVTFVVCFGPDPKDRFEAKVLHKSEQFDMAILKVDRHFIRPLALAGKDLRQGDDILVCGYPGAVIAALNHSANTPDRIVDITRKFRVAHKIEAFDQFSPESFNSTLTKGIVSSPERHIDGAAFMQIDASVGPGNSGGPVLNLENEVVGITTFGLQSGAPGANGTSNYNFALLTAQLLPELTPYLKP